MNVWLSSARTINGTKPENSGTAWEAEIDQRMHEQATSLDPQKRKAAFDESGNRVGAGNRSSTS